MHDTGMNQLLCNNCICIIKPGKWLQVVHVCMYKFVYMCLIHSWYIPVSCIEYVFLALVGCYKLYDQDEPGLHPRAPCDLSHDSACRR